LPFFFRWFLVVPDPGGLQSMLQGDPHLDFF
jgi:hypothetical protein